MFTHFHQIWHVATAMNVKQCDLKLSTSLNKWAPA